MEALRSFLESLPDVSAREEYAKRCGTSLAYLRKMISVWPEFKVGEALAIELDKHSGGKVTCESVRDDVDWEYLRGSRSTPDASTTRSVARAGR